MNNVSRNNIRKSTLIFSTIAILLMVTLSSTPTMNISALDLGLISKDFNVGSTDTDSLFSCIGAAITCDNDNTVNNNVAINNDTNPLPDGPGTLTVSKEIVCESTNGFPSNKAVCEYVLASASYPEPRDFEITVTGNNPNPSSFLASSSGTPVSIGAGDYEIKEIINTDVTDLLNELLPNFIEIGYTDATGDCTFAPTRSTVAVGTMTSADSQECTIVNTLTIDGGTVPGAP